eukprot:5582893-Amphidinium_carterae.1
MADERICMHSTAKSFAILWGIRLIAFCYSSHQCDSWRDQRKVAAIDASATRDTIEIAQNCVHDTCAHIQTPFTKRGPKNAKPKSVESLL